MKIFPLSLSAALLLLTAAAPAQPSASFTDPRDGKNYRTVKIGEQSWMVENLNYEAEGSKCYDNKPENCAKYGRLYDWKTAMNVCPKGWHLPSKEEWEKLTSYIEKDKNCSKCDAKHLKSKSGWNKEGNGLNSYGFAALPAGRVFDEEEAYFEWIGSQGVWWSSSSLEDEDSYAYYLRILYEFDDVDYDEDYKMLRLNSVRCMMD